MGAYMHEDGAEHEPLLVHVSDSGLESHSRAERLFKVVIRAIVILFVIFATFMVFGGLIHGQNEDESLENREHVSYGYLHVGFWFLPGFKREDNTPNWACLCEVVHSHLTSAHHKINKLALTHANAEVVHANVHRLVLQNRDLFKAGAHAVYSEVAKYLTQLVNFYGTTVPRPLKKPQIVDGSVASKIVEMPSSGTHISKLPIGAKRRSHTLTRGRSHTFIQAKIVSFVKIMQDLSVEGLLQAHHRILCLDTGAGLKAHALKKRGFNNVKRIDVSPALKVSNQEVRKALAVSLEDQSFDFAFTTIFDHVAEPALFVAEIERILKVGGLAAMHVSLNGWRNKFVRSKRGSGVKPVTLLFKSSKIVYISSAYAPGLDTIIVFKKVSHIEETRHTGSVKGVDRAEIDAKVYGHSFLPQPATVSIGTKNQCRKCKEQEVILTSVTM